LQRQEEINNHLRKTTALLQLDFQPFFDFLLLTMKRASTVSGVYFFVGKIAAIAANKASDKKLVDPKRLAGWCYKIKVEPSECKPKSRAESREAFSWVKHVFQGGVFHPWYCSSPRPKFAEVSSATNAEVSHTELRYNLRDLPIA
jgi:hypothetical protein